MRIETTVDELLRLARAGGPLPPVLRGVHGHGDAVTVELDGRLVPGLGTAARLAASLAGVVPVVVRPTGVADGVATFALAASVRGVAVQGVVGALAGTVNEQLERRGLPPGAVEVRRTEVGPVAVVALRTLLERAVHGLDVVGLALRDGVVVLDLAVAPHVRRPHRKVE